MVSRANIGKLQVSDKKLTNRLQGRTSLCIHFHCKKDSCVSRTNPAERDADEMLLRHSLFGLRRTLDAARCSAAVGLRSAVNEVGHSEWQLTAPGYQTRGLASPRRDEGLPLDTGRQRLVILGTGWAASRLAKDLNANYYDFTVCITSDVPQASSFGLTAHVAML